MVAEPAVAALPSLRPAVVTIAVSAALVAILMPLDAGLFPDEFVRGGLTPVSLVGAAAALFGHARWITLDRRRRGREVGVWRFFAFCLAPLAVILYLGLEYRRRSLLYIPFYLGILLATACAGGFSAWLVLESGTG